MVLEEEVKNPMTMKMADEPPRPFLLVNDAHGVGGAVTLAVNKCGE